MMPHLNIRQKSWICACFRFARKAISVTEVSSSTNIALYSACEKVKSFTWTNGQTITWWPCAIFYHEPLNENQKILCDMLSSTKLHYCVKAGTKSTTESVQSGKVEFSGEQYFSTNWCATCNILKCLCNNNMW